MIQMQSLAASIGSYSNETKQSCPWCNCLKVKSESVRVVIAKVLAATDWVRAAAIAMVVTTADMVLILISNLPTI
jgi:hypothetical protein